MGVSTLHRSNIKGKTFEFACASRVLCGLGPHVDHFVFTVEPEVGVKQRDVSVLEGEQFVLLCQNEADPAAAVAWQPPREQPIIERDRNLTGYVVGASQQWLQVARIIGPLYALSFPSVRMFK